MKKFSWILVLITLFLISSLSLAAKPILKVGTDATYPPFESIDSSGKFVGFDMELIQLLADEMGMTLKTQNVNWDGIIPGLMNGNYDCIISAMTITPDRKKQIDFSDPYFTIRQAIVVTADNKTVKTPDDLIGKTVAVQNGTTGDLFASKIKNVKMKRFDTNPLAIQELLNKNADAAVMDDLVAVIAWNSNPSLKVIPIQNAEREDYGIGVKKGNPLLGKINKALGNLKKSGKLGKLTLKYKPEA